VGSDSAEREGAVIHVEFAVPVHASRASAWQLLKDKVETPQRFVSQVATCEVMERREDEILRRVTFDDGITVTERVLILPEEELVYHFVDHPKFEGEIRNLLFQAGNSLWLSIYFQGRTRDGVELGARDLEQLREGFARTVLAAAQQIEESERAALETT
jgi:hypothetical protein